jgi:glycosyltransferase involved in cell wall biosynthesis
MPTLDVLIPHWNAPDALRVSLDSVRNQTWSGPLRIVVVDDGSAGPQRASAERITNESNLNATFLGNGTNRGRVYTRNRLLDSMAASHAAWLDAGDSWYPSKIARQFAALAELTAAGRDTDLIWLTCDYDWCLEGQAPMPVVQDVSGDQTEQLLLGDSLRAYLWTLLASTTSLRRVGTFDDKLPRLQDIDFFLRFLVLGGQLAKPSNVTPEPLCRYEKSHVGRDARVVYASHRHIFDKHQALYRSYGRAFERQCRAKASLIAARFALQNRQWPLALSYTARAFSIDARSTFGRVFRSRRRV